MLAVTALIVSWVTVGVVQLPAEALLLGRRFAIYRNLMCFLFAIMISLDSGVILALNQWHVVEQLIAYEQLKMTEYEGR